MEGRLSSYIIRHRIAIIVVWMAVFLLSVPAVTGYGNFLSYSVSSGLPGNTESGNAQKILSAIQSQNSTIEVMILSNSTGQAQLLNSTLAFQSAIDSSAIPYLAGTSSAFSSYASYLDGIISPQRDTINSTYQQLSTLSSTIFLFPSSFYSNWSTFSFSNDSISAAASAAGFEPTNSYEALFIEQLNSTAAITLSPVDRVQHAVVNASSQLFSNNAQLQFILAYEGLQNYTMQYYAATSAALSSLYHLPVTAELVKASVSPGSLGLNFVEGNGLSGMPSFLRDRYVSSNGNAYLVYITFNVSESFRGPDNFYPASAATPTVRNIAQEYFGGNALVTGIGPVAYDTANVTSAAGIFFAFIFVFLFILVLVTLRSLLASILVLVSASLSTLVGYLSIYLIGLALHRIDYIVDYTLTAVLLGVSTDYFVFIAARYREEMIRGKDPKEGMKCALSTAGKAVLISAITVAASLGTLYFVSGLSTWGPVLFIAVIISALLEVTLFSALLSITGRRTFSWKRTPQYDEAAVRYSLFYKSTKLSINHRKAVIMVFLILALPAVLFWFIVPTTYNFNEGLPSNLSSVKALNQLQKQFSSNLIYPITVIVPLTGGDVSNGVPTASGIQLLEGSAQSLLTVSGVSRVYGPFSNGTAYSPDSGYGNYLLNSSGREYAYYIVYTQYDPYSPQAINIVKELRVQSNFIVGGLTSSVIDEQNYTSAAYAELEVLIVIVIAVVLGISLKSVVYPLISISGVFISVAWTTAILYVIERFVLHQQLIYIIPVILFIILMSLGNDFSVFILSRIKEETSSGEGSEGIVKAMVFSGKIVTSLGIILAASLGALALIPDGFLQQMGIAFIVSLILDTFVVRTFYLPTVISAFMKAQPLK